MISSKFFPCFAKLSAPVWLNPTPCPYPFTENFILLFSIVKLKFADFNPNSVLTSTPDKFRFPILIVFTLPPSVYSIIFIHCE